MCQAHWTWSISDMEPWSLHIISQMSLGVGWPLGAGFLCLVLAFRTIEKKQKSSSVPM